MAACGSLQHIFEKPLPENTNLFESLSSWKRLSSMKSSSSTGHLDDNSSSSSSSSSSFTEIFGELHFKETPSSPSSLSSSASSSVLMDVSSQVSAIIIDKSNKNPTTNNVVPTNKTRQYRHSDSFSSMNSESLSMCTEGLGFESFDDVEESKSDVDNPSTHWRPRHRHHRERRSSCINKHAQAEYLSSGESKRSRISGVEFPPPISCIGRTGKPWVCFKSYRTNGRFILKEVRIPTQEFLHACREDGRLKLQFIQSDDEKIDEEDDEEEEEEESVDLNVTNEEDDNNGGHDDNPNEKDQEKDAEKDEKRGG